jgi:hypothetical protein
MAARSKIRTPLARLIGNPDALLAGIEDRNGIAKSEILRARLRAIIAGDVSRWTRPPKQGDIERSVQKAEELLRAIHSLKNFGHLLAQWNERWALTTSDARMHNRLLGEAIHRLGLNIDCAALRWANERWPQFDDDLVQVIQLWASPKPHNARKNPKRDPNESYLIQLIAVILRAAGAKRSAMRSDGTRTAFQETCYAVLLAKRHVHCAHTGARQVLGPETEEALYERIVELFKDQSLRQTIEEVAEIARNDRQLDRIESDLSMYAHMLWDPRLLNYGVVIGEKK